MLEKDMKTKIYNTTAHPEVATTLSQIAQQWSYMGDVQKALQQFEKVLGKKNLLHIHVADYLTVGVEASNWIFY